MARRKPNPIAEPNEILTVMSRILRGEPTGAEDAPTPKVAEQVRAAELLGRQYGLFRDKDENHPALTLPEELRRVMEDLHEQNHNA